MQTSPQDPTSPHEVGILRSFGNGKSQFIGSSSGVYFVNTVRRAFSAANADIRSYTASPQPSPEDCIVGGNEDDEATNSVGPTRRGPLVNGPGSLSYGQVVPEELGKPPPRNLAQQLLVIYFRTWHPLFPFLHGPTLVQQVDQFYSTAANGNANRGLSHSHVLARAIILQCVFNLATLDGPPLPLESRIDRAASLIAPLATLAIRSDLESLQALLAAQLLLVARMSLRESSAVGGLLCRSIYQAGLHRCPVRYGELSDNDCDLRKRIFWSAYVIDRYLSQTLGHPLGIQDSDIDVCCIDGTEIHKILTPDGASVSGHEAEANPSAIRQNTGLRASSISSPPDPNPVASPTGSTVGPRPSIIRRDSNHAKAAADARQISRQLALAHHVKHARLVGRAVELFHKSIHVRSMDPDAVWRLRADVSAWWNNLPASLQEDEQTSELLNGTKNNSGGKREAGILLSIFFRILHHQQIMLINRPWLSLEPSSPEFNAALQACVCASREIIMTLRSQQGSNYSTLTWPAHLSAVWMGGLLIAFACQLRSYSMEKGRKEIQYCLEILESMSTRWPMAKHCYAVLSHLQSAFHAREKVSIANLTGSSPASRDEISTPEKERKGDQDDALPPTKRQRLDPTAQTNGNAISANRTASLNPRSTPVGNTNKDTHSAMTIPATPEPNMGSFGQPDPQQFQHAMQHFPIFDGNGMPGPSGVQDSPFGIFDDGLSGAWDSGLADVFGGLHALPFNWEIPSAGLGGSFG
jgi:Fungal specific transcription factor domain